MIAARDVLLVGYLLVMGVVAWVVPEALWPATCRVIARAAAPFRGTRARVARVRSLLGTAEADARRIVGRLRTNVHMRQLQYLRVLRPGGWRPTLRLEGAERIHDVLANGRGVILWVSPLVFGDLVTKMALAREGVRVVHLSSYTHGFSPTRFGFRVLNRIAAAAEERFVAERLVMTPGKPAGALRELTIRVRQGDVVSISALLAEGQRGVTVPFGQGTLTLADGAPQLSRRTGTQLLCVFTVRLDDGSFTTTVGDPIDMDSGSRDEAVNRAVEAYARELSRIATVAPDQIPLFTRAFAPGR